MTSTGTIIPSPAEQKSEMTALLHQLIQENRATYGLFYNGKLHNHVQHGLSAAYHLDCNKEQLKAIGLKEEERLQPWGNRKTTRITTDDDVEKHLGDVSFEGDYVEFFEHENDGLNNLGKSMLQYWMVDRSKPFLPGLVGGYGHPLILLADAVELKSSALITDALALTAIDWSPLSDIIQAPLSGYPGPQPDTLFQILDMVRQDQTFSGLIPTPTTGIQNIGKILTNPAAKERVMRYYTLGCVHLLLDPDVQNTGISTETISIEAHYLAASHPPGNPTFDFYLSHNLTFVKCIRIIYPVLSGSEAKESLIRIYWLLTVLAFVTQGRPRFTDDLTLTTGEEPKTWDEIRDVALSKPGSSNDAHFLKAVQILVDLGTEKKELEAWSRGAVMKLISHFDKWSGF